MLLNQITGNSRVLNYRTLKFMALRDVECSHIYGTCPLLHCHVNVWRGKNPRIGAVWRVEKRC